MSERNHNSQDPSPLPGKHTGNPSENTSANTSNIYRPDSANLDNQILRAFQDKKGNGLPEDKYFKKIWNSIEIKAPVGEKYYLRTFFMVFLLLVFFIIFILFYTDFLSSVLTIKEIHKENTAYFNTSPTLITTPFDSRTLGKEIQMAGTVSVIARAESNIRLKSQDNKTVVIDFLNGHAVFCKTADPRQLTIRLPGASLRLIENGTMCNIYCYDDMIRIIPISHALEIKTGDTGNKNLHSVKRTEIFFLLHGRPVIINAASVETVN